MSNIGKLSVELSADVAKFKSSLKEAEASVTGFRDHVPTSIKNVSESLGGLPGIALAAGAAFGTIGQQLMSTIEGLDKLNDVADATGASIEGISKLENIALKTGASIDTVESALTKLVAQQEKLMARTM